MRGIAAAVPDLESPLADEVDSFGKEAIEKICASTGIVSRRLAPSHVTAADLCESAASALLRRLAWEPTSVGLVVFMTQTPDFQIPSTACLLQERLGLGKNTAAFDVNLGCSAYAYSLWLASSLLGTMSQKRALVLVGDTLTRHVNRSDRALWPLFGDAGTATALEQSPDAPPMTFELGTDGSGWDHLLIDKRRSDSSLDSSTLQMDGPAVFSFALREVPPMVSRLMEVAGTDLDSMDYVILHQANQFILRTLQRRLKIPDSKFVVDLATWGNTSGATIPLAIVSSLRDQLTAGSHRLLLAGFGVGLSWSALVVDLNQSVEIPPISEVAAPSQDFG